jgi:hypothetical protein
MWEFLRPNRFKVHLSVAIFAVVWVAMQTLELVKEHVVFNLLPDARPLIDEMNTKMEISLHKVSFFDPKVRMSLIMLSVTYAATYLVSSYLLSCIAEHLAWRNDGRRRLE